MRRRWFLASIAAALFPIRAEGMMLFDGESIARIQASLEGKDIFEIRVIGNSVLDIITEPNVPHDEKTVILWKKPKRDTRFKEL